MPILSHLNAIPPYACIHMHIHTHIYLLRPHTICPIVGHSCQVVHRHNQAKKLGINNKKVLLEIIQLSNSRCGEFSLTWTPSRNKPPSPLSDAKWFVRLRWASNTARSQPHESGFSNIRKKEPAVRVCGANHAVKSMSKFAKRNIFHFSCCIPKMKKIVR